MSASSPGAGRGSGRARPAAGSDAAISRSARGCTNFQESSVVRRLAHEPESRAAPRSSKPRRRSRPVPPTSTCTIQARCGEEQVHVVHALDLGALDVDDLLVEELAPEQDLVGAAPRACLEASVGNKVRRIGPDGSYSRRPGRAPPDGRGRRRSGTNVVGQGRAGKMSPLAQPTSTRRPTSSPSRVQHRPVEEAARGRKTPRRCAGVLGLPSPLFSVIARSNAVPRPGGRQCTARAGLPPAAPVRGVHQHRARSRSFSRGKPGRTRQALTPSPSGGNLDSDEKRISVDERSVRSKADTPIPAQRRMKCPAGNGRARTAVGPRHTSGGEMPKNPSDGSRHFGVGLSRRRFLQEGGAALAAGLVLPSVSAAAAPRRRLRPSPPLTRPNIVILMTDQERYPQHWPDGWADANLPNRKRLARHGLTFTRAFCAAACARRAAPPLHRPVPGRARRDRGPAVRRRHHGRGHRPDDAAARRARTWPLLASAGYDVQYRGKWHMSKDPSGTLAVQSRRDLEHYGFKGWLPPDAGGDQSSGHVRRRRPPTTTRLYRGPGRGVPPDAPTRRSRRPFALFVSPREPARRHGLPEDVGRSRATATSRPTRARPTTPTITRLRRAGHRAAVHLATRLLRRTTSRTPGAVHDDVDPRARTRS